MAVTDAVDVSEQGLDSGDIAVVVVYFVVVVCIGLYASCRATRGTVSGYFLAGRSMLFPMVGASLFVSNIGSEHFIGLAGSGAASGIGVGAWEFNAILLLQLLGFVFVPVYIACKTYTMPEYLHKRFGGQRLRVYFAFLSLVLYIFTKCSVDLYTGALFIQQSLGWDLYLSIVILISVVALLTVTGGLTAVIYTDTLQAALMVGGAIVLMIMGFNEVGGFDGLWRKYPHAMPNDTVNGTDCHVPNENWDVMLRNPSDKDMPWPGFLLGQTPGSIWYWCSDQVIVQRALAAKSLSHAQGATIMAAFVKILPLFIMVMPGMISRVLFPDQVACVVPEKCYEYCQSKAGCTNIAYPLLVLRIMPAGLRGLMMAVMIAALMSDLDSIFNSASTLFTIDIYKRIRKEAGVTELMVAGRVFVIVMVGVAIAWVPVVKETQGGQVFIYIQEVTDYLAPQVACVFLIALLWDRCNEKGAFWGLMVGLVAGVARLVVVFVYKDEGHCGEEDTRPTFLKDFHYMYYAMFLFWLTFVVTVGVSLFTKELPPEYAWRATFWSRHDKRSLEEVRGQNKREKGVQVFDNPNLEIEDDDVVAIPNMRSFGTQWDEKIEGGTQGIYTISENSTEPHSSDSTGVAKRSFKQLFISWLCGVGSASQEEQSAADKKEISISSLDQDPTAKKILYFLLLIILGIGVFLYCFWSLWKYTPSEIQDELNGFNNNTVAP